MLTIDRLSVEYFRRGSRVQALRDVSLSIQAGETLGVVGESGSGKSTLALAILQLIFPHEGRITNGEIRFEGKDLLKVSAETMRDLRGRRISMIFQDPFTTLNPVLPIRTLMSEVLLAHQKPIEEGKLIRAFEDVQLDAARVLQAYPHQLSGGQRQRVMIAMAILTEPSLLLADEPTTALDVIVQREILELLFELQKKKGMAVLFISHNLGLVAKYTQRIAVLRAGEKVEEAPTRQLFTRPAHDYTRQLIDSIPRLTRTH